MKKDLLFYEAYEDFYDMASKSQVFKEFCKEAFGQDFSQDGFSDINQIDKILPYIPMDKEAHILDIGCGNGKMLGYLQEKTGAYIYGFDYSDQAINQAKEVYKDKADFREGVINEIEYPEESFDVIVSMDSMYFAKDMTAFVASIRKWLKPGGVLFVAYQEGDVVDKTENTETTLFADAMKANGWNYEVSDITKDSYDVLVKKREVALKYKDALEKEGYSEWADLLVMQTDYINDGYEEYSKNLSRYIYVAKK